MAGCSVPGLRSQSLAACSFPVCSRSIRSFLQRPGPFTPTPLTRRPCPFAVAHPHTPPSSHQSSPPTPLPGAGVVALPEQTQGHDIELQDACTLPTGNGQPLIACR